jgi:hypothetical protein
VALVRAAEGGEAAMAAVCVAVARETEGEAAATAEGIARRRGVWELATGMLENDRKREGMLVGALRKHPERAPHIYPTL